MWQVVADMAVAVAEGEAAAGAAEIGGNNAGPFVERYLNANHPAEISHHGEPWCVAFFCWCWMEAGRRAGVKLPVTYTRSSGTLWARMSEHGQVFTRAEVRGPAQLSGPLGTRCPEPGDAVFWDFTGNGEPDHVNMVHHLDEDGALYTIGGNEGNEASGAPVRVKRRGPLGELPRVLGFGRMYRELP